MEENPYINEDKEQRRRVIIVATTIAIIILGIAVWSIIAIVGGSKKNTEQVAQVATTSETSSKETQAVSKTTETEAPASEGVSTVVENAQPVVKNTATSVATDAVPETGPEELLPLALVLGGITAFVSSKKLATREA